MSIDFSVSLRTSSTGIIAEIEPQGNLIDPEFAFYLFNGKERVARKPYSRQTAGWKLQGIGIYNREVFRHQVIEVLEND